MLKSCWISRARRPEQGSKMPTQHISSNLFNFHQLHKSFFYILAVAYLTNNCKQQRRTVSCNHCRTRVAKLRGWFPNFPEPACSNQTHELFIFYKAGKFKTNGLLLGADTRVGLGREGMISSNDTVSSH